MLRADKVSKYKDIENGDWKFLNIDSKTGDLVCPGGSSGHRWDGKDGNWNMKFEDAETGKDYDPVLTLLEKNDEVLQVDFVELWKRNAMRGVPVKHIKTVDGIVKVTTVYDLIMAQYGVDRGFGGDYPASYEEKDQAYTPAWQEIFTGIAAKNSSSICP